MSPHDSPPMLAAEGLTRKFGERVAVAGLSFTLASGEALGFLGPNGAGKSTTFALLTGMLKPHGGTIRWKGAPISPLDTAYRARIGVVFQKPSLDDKLTGLENLRLGAALYGLPSRVAEERILRLAQLVELSDRIRETVERYSGGMRRRLELARVLLHEPELLIMDEPTAGLDIAGSRRIWQKIIELKRAARASILLTTHDPEEAALCDRIIVLDQGKIIAEGSPAALCSRVGGDVVTIEGENPDELSAALSARLGVDARVLDGKVVFERAGAHELVPRIAEAFPGRLRSISMRPPSLGDVFVKLTGRQLATSTDEAA